MLGGPRVAPVCGFEPHLFRHPYSHMAYAAFVMISLTCLGYMCRFMGETIFTCRPAMLSIWLNNYGEFAIGGTPLRDVCASPKVSCLSTHLSNQGRNQFSYDEAGPTQTVQIAYQAPCTEDRQPLHPGEGHSTVGVACQAVGHTQVRRVFGGFLATLFVTGTSECLRVGLRGALVAACHAVQDGRVVVTSLSAILGSRFA